MLAYRHLFHAGNFADVFKHALLARLLLGLQRKEAPFCFLDTHAGIGHYDLGHAWAQKNREFERGAGRILGRGDAPALLAPYLEALRAENAQGALRAYPGSPVLAQRLLRAQDRMVLCELNARDHEALRARFAREPRAGVHHLDGFLAVKAHLPPKERRGLMLMDPSFDRAGELQRVRDAFAEAQRRFASGVMAFWMPTMDAASMLAFERSMREVAAKPLLQLELWLGGDAATGLRGNRMVVANPPWGFEQEARALLPWLAGALADGPGAGSRVRLLPPLGAREAEDASGSDDAGDLPRKPAPGAGLSSDFYFKRRRQAAVKPPPRKGRRTRSAR